jgi:hypothetical protein
MRKRILPALLAFVLLASQALATWSIVVVNLETGEVAVATATCLEGFNIRRATPVLIPGVGVATAQSAVDNWGSRVMIHDGMLAGDSLKQILADLASADNLHQLRQYGIVNMKGEALTFTGAQAGAWKGGLTGQSGSMVYAIQGNVLSGDKVILEAEQALLNTPGDLAEKMMAAMEAAAAFGGDGRCSCNMVQPTSCGNPPPPPFKSAHIACFLIGRPGDVLTSCTTANGCAKGDFYLALNERDLTAADPDPVLLLRQDYDAWRAALAGVPDAIHSEVIAPQDRVDAGQTQTLTYVLSLADVNSQWIGQGGCTITLAHAEGTQSEATLLGFTDHQDGTYSVDIQPATNPGMDHLLFLVDDGSGPVTMWPPTGLMHTPWLQVDPLIGGVQAELKISGAQANGPASFAFSLAGPGPSMTPWGMVNLSSPIRALATIGTNAEGDASVNVPIPSGFPGRPVWIQAGYLNSNGLTISNPITTELQ